MKKYIKRLGTILYYAAGLAVIGFIVFSVGLTNIYHALLNTNLSFVYISIGITLVSSLLRVYKIWLLLYSYKYSHAEVFELFIFSRVGKELSFAGYFFPIVKKNNRNLSTFENLFIDRYTEIFSTILLGFISLLFIIKFDLFHFFLFVALCGSLLILILIPFIYIGGIAKYIKNKFILKFLNFIANLQVKLKVFRKDIWKIYLLSILATSLDFIVAYLLLEAFNVDLNFLIIPVVWASSGLISILGFMIIGSTEISVIYLYEKLGGVLPAITASFVFISRVINIICLCILLIFNLLRLAINRIKFSRVKTLNN